ncbi:hypothetical protein [Flavobacterium granuli]|uniref:Lipoprotein n=1 Tax=Flavobacterium granuli TaxID=280093 RepID=A0A1M5R9V8_9FLAO|nr:hypothetical protein [Flavobacterium granuli]PRZ21657.1 hypothetical protein BC624_10897 [Flavobacterium granuli]SHH22806.1 hypothetical protein SAMN05443373_10996 [Flavobacterium granuli]
MKYLSLAIVFLLFSCGNKEDILLAKSDRTVVSEVVDHSPIYIFFRTKDKDTLAEVNRNNSIITTNWILNIDKRLPLRIVIPEVIKLQEKKRKEKAHKNEKAENYYAYADSIGKNLAFIPFTNVYYKTGKPKFGVVIFFDKNNEILVNNISVKREKIQNYLDSLSTDKSNKFFFCFAENLPYENYIQDKILIETLKFPMPELNLTNEEFIY